MLLRGQKPTPEGEKKGEIALSTGLAGNQTEMSQKWAMAIGKKQQTVRSLQFGRALVDGACFLNNFRHY